MKRIVFAWSALLLLMAFTGWNCSCGGSPTESTPPGIAVEWVEPDPMANVVSGAVTLEARVLYGFTPDRVRFSVGGETIGEVAAAPYSLIWDPGRDEGQGVRVLNAEALDGDGTVLASDATNVFVVDLEHYYAGRYGGGDEDRAFAVDLAPGGAVVFAGDVTNDLGETHGFLLHANEAAGARWFRGWNDWGRVRSLEALAGSGYVVAGWQEQGIAGRAIWVQRLTAEGDKLWESVYGTNQVENLARCIQQTADGGFIVAGEQFADALSALLVKLEPDGREDWRREFAGNLTASAYSVRETTDGGYILTGYHSEPWADLLLLVKTNASGVETWSETYSWGGNYNVGRDVRETADGGFVVAGGASNAMLLLRVDAQGGELWHRLYEERAWGLGLALEITSDGGFIVAGTAGGDLRLVKTDAEGIEQWSRSFGDEGDDRAQALRELSGGGYLVAGVTTAEGGDADAWLLEIDAEGNPVAGRSAGFAGGEAALGLR